MAEWDLFFGFVGFALVFVGVVGVIVAGIRRKKLKRWCIFIIVGVFIVLVSGALVLRKSQVEKERPRAEKGTADGAEVYVDGTRLCVYRMSTRHPDEYKRLSRWIGKEYVFLVLVIDNTKGGETFNWGASASSVVVELVDGRRIESFDASDMDEYWNFPSDLRDKLRGWKNVVPGKKAVRYLVFYPSFSWKDISAVYFHTGLFGFGKRKGNWITVKTEN